MSMQRRAKYAAILKRKQLMTNDFRDAKAFFIKANRGPQAKYPHMICYDKEAWKPLQNQGLLRVVIANKQKGSKLELLLTFNKKINFWTMQDKFPTFKDVIFSHQIGCPHFWMKKCSKAGVPLYTMKFPQRRTMLNEAAEAEAKANEAQAEPLTEAEINKYFPIRIRFDVTV